MAGNPAPDDLMIVLLRAIRGDIGEMKTDMGEVNERLGLLESNYSSISRRVDRIGGNIEMLKRRYDVVEAS